MKEKKDTKKKQSDWTHIRVRRETKALVNEMLWLDDHNKVSADVAVVLGMRELKRRKERIDSLNSEERSLLNEAHDDVRQWIDRYGQMSKTHLEQIDLLENQYQQQLNQERALKLQEQSALAMVCSVLAKTAALNELICVRNMSWKPKDYHRAATQIIDDSDKHIERLSHSYMKKAIDHVNANGVPDQAQTMEQSTGLFDRVLKLFSRG